MSDFLAAIAWEPVFPVALIFLVWLALAALAIWSSWRSGPSLPLWKRGLIAFFRLGALALLMIPLLQPFEEESIPRHHPERFVSVVVDTSASMAEKDADGSTRLDAARALIAKHHLAGRSDIGLGQVHQFDVESKPVAPENLDNLQPTGETTHFDASLRQVFKSTKSDQRSAGLILFTDGHDFEGIPPERTGKAALQQHVPIYPVPLGKTVQLPDIGVTMISTQPMTFVQQKARLEAAVKFRSCGSRQIRVELLRAGQLVRHQEIRTGGDGEIPVGFDVSEAEPGQHEYEIRCPGVNEERDLENNSATTFLNVTDARIPILLLEGEAHWDTGFLQRTLARNDRMSLDAVVAISKTRLHTARSDAALPALGAISPKMLETYPILILGRGMERLLNPECIAYISKAVNESGLTLIYSRGRPGSSSVWDDLSPAPLDATSTGPFNVTVSGARGEVVPLEVLAAFGQDKLPALPASAVLGKPKTLASIEARAENSQQKNSLPAMVLRQQGNGQVFAVALDGLWKWALHAGAETDNNVYERFWNQLILNLISRSSRAPSDRPQVIISRANLELGEQMHFQLKVPQREGKPATIATAPQLRITRSGGGSDAIVLDLKREDPAAPWTGTLLAEQAGKFTAETTLPGGEKISCRFGVQAPKKETTDVATDVNYLRKLAMTSGGRLLETGALASLVQSLSQAAAAENSSPPVIRRTSLWDTPMFFWTLCGMFGADWFLRRRWGLV